MADLQPLKPDVVLLQEAPSREALARMTTGLFGEQGAFVATGDVAILTRGTIGEPFGERGGDYIGANVRLHAGCEVQCISLRLAPPPPRFDPWSWQFWTEHRHLRETHRRQLGQLQQALANGESHSAVILGGDFNTTPLDAALSQLKPEFADAFSRRGVGWGATGTNDWPLFRVDQIWTNLNCQPMQVSAIKTARSDHRLVVCDVEVRE
ncbi:MAG: endonuclease/exonuclease/phosphatase family protein [Pirellulaceae bacterium]|nr:endonuclease/exonuclease/phosphatase family protein [Pirellulaceae bacterium]